MPLPNAIDLSALDLSGVEAVVLHGSYARGDATATSDVDLHAIYEVLDGRIPPFQVVQMGGYSVEIHAGTVVSIEQKMRQRPAWAHSWGRAEHLWGEAAITRRLMQSANAILAGYQVDPADLRGTRHWIASAVQKIAAAQEGGDLQYAGYLVATNTWELLEGLWQINALPIPASRLAYLLTPTLKRLPVDFARLYAALYTGDPPARVDAYLRIGGWANSLEPDQPTAQRE
jgi:hypothetical protein